MLESAEARPHDKVWIHAEGEVDVRPFASQFADAGNDGSSSAYVPLTPMIGA